MDRGRRSKALAADLGRARRDAVAELVGAFEAQDLLNRRLDHLRPGNQSLLLAGPSGERHEAVADQVGGRLVAGIQQEDAIVQELLLAEPIARALACDEPGED